MGGIFSYGEDTCKQCGQLYIPECCPGCLDHMCRECRKRRAEEYEERERTWYRLHSLNRTATTTFFISRLYRTLKEAEEERDRVQPGVTPLRITVGGMIVWHGEEEDPSEPIKFTLKQE